MLPLFFCKQLIKLKAHLRLIFHAYTGILIKTQIEGVYLYDIRFYSDIIFLQQCHLYYHCPYNIIHQLFDTSDKNITSYLKILSFHITYV